MSGLSECCDCGETKPWDEFYLSGGRPNSRCKACHRDLTRRRRRVTVARRGGISETLQPITPGGMGSHERVAFVQRVKVANGCTDCGTSAGVLDLDHLPQYQKVADVAYMATRTGRFTDAEVIAEIAKCEVACRSCHIARTVQRKRVPRDYEEHRVPVLPMQEKSA